MRKRRGEMTGQDDRESLEENEGVERKRKKRRRRWEAVKWIWR